MSRVYEYELQMAELAQDSSWNELQERQEAEMRADLDMMQAFEDFIGDVEENKAREFARKIIEVA